MPNIPAFVPCQQSEEHVCCPLVFKPTAYTEQNCSASRESQYDNKTDQPQPVKSNHTVILTKLSWDSKFALYNKNL